MTAKEIDNRRKAYQDLFDSPNGKVVIQDLATFAGVTKKAYSHGMNDLDLAYRAGMRDLYQRIQTHLNVSDDYIWYLYESESKSNNRGEYE